MVSSVWPTLTSRASTKIAQPVSKIFRTKVRWAYGAATIFGKGLVRLLENSAIPGIKPTKELWPKGVEDVEEIIADFTLRDCATAAINRAEDADSPKTNRQGVV
jgi:hypothetical protein